MNIVMCSVLCHHIFLAENVHNHDRNIKDIVKLKGSEDLWEVAKLHDRDSSFPVVIIS